MSRHLSVRWIRTTSTPRPSPSPSNEDGEGVGSRPSCQRWCRRRGPTLSQSFAAFDENDLAWDDFQGRSTRADPAQPGRRQEPDEGRSQSSRSSRSSRTSRSPPRPFRGPRVSASDRSWLRIPSRGTNNQVQRTLIHTGSTSTVPATILATMTAMRRRLPDSLVGRGVVRHGPSFSWPPCREWADSATAGTASGSAGPFGPRVSGT